MRDYLKILDLWTYIEEQTTEPIGVSEAKLATWKTSHNKTCTALCLMVDENAYSNIEDLINASTVWKLLESNFKP